jgi:hypothetical protein
MNGTMIECGFYRLAETQVFRYAGYECAAWWKEVEVPAGDYLVKAWIKDGRVESFFAEQLGTHVADNIQSLYCGPRTTRSRTRARLRVTVSASPITRHFSQWRRVSPRGTSMS